MDTRVSALSIALSDTDFSVRSRLRKFGCIQPYWSASWIDGDYIRLVVVRPKIPAREGTPHISVAASLMAAMRGHTWSGLLPALLPHSLQA